MFVPQVVLAITAAALSPVWARRWSLQRVLQAGLIANCAAMLLLVLSQVVSTTGAAYPILLCATGALGFGFGCTVPALNTFAARLDPDRQDRSVLTLNALLGTGTALAPLLIAVFLALGAWWLLPVLAAAALAGFVVAAIRTPLSLSLAGQEFPRLGATSSGGTDRRVPGRLRDHRIRVRPAGADHRDRPVRHLPRGRRCRRRARGRRPGCHHAAGPSPPDPRLEQCM